MLGRSPEDCHDQLVGAALTRGGGGVDAKIREYGEVADDDSGLFIVWIRWR